MRAYRKPPCPRFSEARARLGEITYVVLAAGSSRRMGFAKATTLLAGRSPLARFAELLADRQVVVVTTAALQPLVSHDVPRATVLVNDEPERGMSSSLLVAHRAIAATATLGVLLADKPLVARDTLERCERAYAMEPCDVLFASCGGCGGHPVFFGPPARARLALLPSGDTLRELRDDPGLVRVSVDCDDAGVLDDLDTPAAWRAAEHRLRA